MISLLRRPAVVFHFLLFLFAAWLAWGWLPQGPSAEELSFQLTKAADFERACRSVHGLAWWTPSYMQGHSLAPVWATPFSTVALELCRLVVPGIAGYKAAGLLALVAAGIAMFRFAEEFTGCAATAAWAAALYVLLPELSVRLAEAEHLTIAFCFPLAPLLCLLLWRLRERGTAFDLVLLALGLAGSLLVNTKVISLFLPVAAAFALWLARGDGGRRFLARAAGAALLALPLTVLPMLPTLREQQWMTLFAHDPMAAWQHGFTVKSALAWWDRGGALLSAPGSPFAGGRSFYLGLVPLAALAAVALGRGPLRGWRETEAGRRCLFFLGAALLLEWLSHGPGSIWGGLVETLQGSGALPSWSLGLLWLAFAGQGALAFLVAGLWTGRPWLRAAIVAAYLLLPLFPFFEKIPLYGQLRAPAAFWNVGGTFCVALAAGLALQGIAERLPFLKSPDARLAAGWLAVAAALLDFSPYRAAFRNGALPDGVYADFLRAADFLRDDKGAGDVFSISGRYFYIEIPVLSGRPLWSEAATSYFQMRWTRDLAAAGRQSAAALGESLAAGGVGFVLIDKGDPQAIPEFDAFLRARYPVAYENPGFAVLRCPTPDMPAMATGRVEVMPEGAPTAATLAAALGEAAADRWPLAPGLPPRAVPVPHGVPGDAPSAPLALRQPRYADYQTIAVEAAPPGRPWVVVPESYHPDWRAEADGKEIPVYRALGAYLAARAPRDGAAVTFHFRPPWWYPASLAAAALAWLAAISAAVALRPRR